MLEVYARRAAIPACRPGGPVILCAGVLFTSARSASSLIRGRRIPRRIGTPRSNRASNTRVLQTVVRAGRYW